MRLMRYSFTLTHVPGKSIATADTLSRARVMNTALSVGELSEADVSAHVEGVVQYAFSDDMLERIRSEQANDPECASLLEACMQGWPAKHHTPQLLKQFWAHRGNITVCKQLLLKDSRLVIPRALRKEMLRRVHEGHQGIARCRASARECLWWPGIGKDIAQTVANCQACSIERTQFSEPMIPSETTELPWQKIGIDLFEMKGAVYLVVVDYHSRYPELALLDQGTSSKAVIQHLKSCFARHGIPQTVISDNGPQFISFPFADFARNYGFRHVTTSPRYPQANGEAERMVGTLKRLLKKAEDPYIALLNYRNTPGPTGYSPAQLLMSRRLRSKVPCMPSALRPEVVKASWKEQDEKYRQKQKMYFDKRHAARPLPCLSAGTQVWLKDRGAEGTVLRPSKTPRSYWVQTEGKTVRRNRRHLFLLPHGGETSPVKSEQHPRNNEPTDATDKDTVATKSSDIQEPRSSNETSSPEQRTTRYGRVIRAPKRLGIDD
ncbi:uncharacterized protein K02A2.6-like [Rhipicephalus sanguineus]|uniref:uncharacterized protein K02A2.6-like n=1 Tax=Rhipicephalus sanguineus TaxID=34632 RepID=UPI0020C579F5|nr:uncharacterized protein K02A2.6-like [Rhipicephalus sanguineus]